MEFFSEYYFSEEFFNVISSDKSPWGNLKIAKEFNYLRGRTDIIATMDDDTLIAFELKLEKWRDALQQAYKNTCFAHKSFVVLPEYFALRAIRNLYEFEKRSVGLCYIKDGLVNVLLDAVFNVPIQPWLTNKAVTMTYK